MQPELQSGTMIFKHVLKVRKAKRIAMFDGFEPRRCEDIKGIVTPEIGPNSFGTSEKQVPVGRFSKVPKTFRAFLKLRLAYSVELVFSYDVWGMKIKTAKFRALRRLYFEDTKRSMSPELRPKSFGTFEKRAPGLEKCRRTFQPRSQHPLCRL